MTCPNCGEEVPPRAKACRACGSCEETGWSEAAQTESGLDLPEEEFDYDSFAKREFGGKDPKPRGTTWIWWVAAIVVLLVFLFLMVH